jgi:ribosome-interacting GTPase 1
MMAESQIVEGIKEAIARQLHDKHVSMAMSKHATIEELSEMMFSVRSVLRLYSKDCHESKVNCQLEVGVSG